MGRQPSTVFVNTGHKAELETYLAQAQMCHLAISAFASQKRIT